MAASLYAKTKLNIADGYMKEKIKNKGSLKSRYGKWTILDVIPRGRQGKDCLCRCDCGHEAIVAATSLRGGRTTQCTECAKKINRFPNSKYDHSKWLGKKFGKLTVIGFGEVTGADGTLYICECECGFTKGYSGSKLKNGKIMQCLHCSNSAKGKKHGFYKYPEYKVWQSIKSRCTNPSDKGYPAYGGRGISICKEWAESFETFIEDIGFRPQEGLTLDRIDNDRGYEPGNVRWVTHMINSNNTRKNVRYTKNGATYTARELAEKFSVPYSRMNWCLIRYGIDWVFDNIERVREIKRKKLCTSFGGKMVESFRNALPDRLYIKCHKLAFEQSTATLYDSGLVERLFFSNPKDVNVSEGEIVLDVSAAEVRAYSKAPFVPVKDGCWKSSCLIHMAHIREYKKPSP
jgi:hypothetical protein